VRAIDRAVVGHDPLGDDAVAAEPDERPVEESDGASLALVGQDLAAGEPCSITWRICPPPWAARSGAIAGDAVAPAVDLAELLGVDVQQLAGVGALIAEYGRPGLERARRPRPIRRSARPTVETGRPSRRAIYGPLQRCRRRRSIAAVTSAGNRWGQRAGAELRSRSARSPPARYRASPL